ncbi:hypothetical protein BN1356_00784 [Streptococcus varani]|uniref:Uncharacterized protein n=1 Tax=Streptococcus varani TaxID=1608583 RepID=A0A0E4H3D4_9STRE|nr:hypothetical protein [Streptococcus varani]CQR24438.1 hypothetical protein BN1356_00784 [Streptococcus varani]
MFENRLILEALWLQAPLLLLLFLFNLIFADISETEIVFVVSFVLVLLDQLFGFLGTNGKMKKNSTYQWHKFIIYMLCFLVIGLFAIAIYGLLLLFNHPY